MKYHELYTVWTKEKKDENIQSLPKIFFVKLSQYVKSLNGDKHILDEKDVRTQIKLKERQYVKKMITDLIQIRYRKILKSALERGSIPLENLTTEEETTQDNIKPIKDVFNKILTDVLNGRAPVVCGCKEGPKRILVRTLHAIPAVVGLDMKIYGPFEKEDIASLPPENAKILIQNGMAKRVEIP